MKANNEAHRKHPITPAHQDQDNGEEPDIDLAGYPTNVWVLTLTELIVEAFAAPAKLPESPPLQRADELEYDGVDLLTTEPRTADLTRL